MNDTPEETTQSCKECAHRCGRCDFSECEQQKTREVVTIQGTLIGTYCRPHAVMQLNVHDDAFWLHPVGWHAVNHSRYKARRRAALLGVQP